jgi:creatinine amidohydrolase
MEQSRRSFMSMLAATGAAGIGASFEAGAAENSVPNRKDAFVPPESVLLYECTHREIRERINSGALKLAIIPVGSTEQHNQHLAMIMDTAAALLVSQQAALAFFPRVIVTTPVPIGISPYWMTRQGSLTLRPETFLGFISDICASLKAQGIRRVLVVNGHGGNTKPLTAGIPDIVKELGITIEALSYWDTMPREETLALMESKDYPGHASEFETSFALAAFPQRVRRVKFEEEDPAAFTPDPEALKRVGYYRETFDVPGYDKQHFADALLGTREKGEKCIGMAVEGIKARIEKLLA